MASKVHNQIQITERELLVATRELDEIHHATLPALHEAVAEWTEVREQSGGPDPDHTAATPHQASRLVGSSRRGFLVGAGATVGGLLLAACGSSRSSSPTTSTGGKGATGGATYTGDLAIAALAASLENLAVQTYQAGLDAATAGRLGTVPPAIATFATTARSQHRDHAAAWNSILTGAGKAMVTGVDTTVKSAVVTPGFAMVHNAVDLAKFALTLEESAAATYLGGIMALSAPSAIKIAATIQPVEKQHAAILNLVIGNYPVPNSFSTTEGARTPSDTIG